MTWQIGCPPCDGFYYIKRESGIELTRWISNFGFFYPVSSRGWWGTIGSQWLGPITPEMCEAVGEARELIGIVTQQWPIYDTHIMSRLEAWLKKTEGK